VLTVLAAPALVRVMREAVRLFLAMALCAALPVPASAGALFKDGLLGLTQQELRAKLGPPQKVRIRMAAQRVYNYHTLDTWENVLKDQMSGTMAEDVYLFTREGIKVRYSFQFIEEYKPNSDTPTLLVNLVDIEFMEGEASQTFVEAPVAVLSSVPIANLEKLVPEFRPSPADDASAFRSNLFVILIQDPTSPDARKLIKERHRDEYEWSLAYRLYSSEGLPQRVRLSDVVSRMEFSVDSGKFIRETQKITHEALLNPFSEKAKQLPPPSEPAKKAIPKPRYAP
jgi:hypothetical protein